MVPNVRSSYMKQQQQQQQQQQFLKISFLQKVFNF
jgi:hypothetical protein